VTADLGGSCADLARWLPVAAALMAEPDTDGAMAHGQPASRPPWNPAAANAFHDADEGVRRLEASLRLAVTGRPGPRRGGSGAATMAALDAVENLGEAVTATAMAKAARILDRWSRAIQQLPAVDEAERPQKVTTECPYCKFKMLRVFPREGRVTCLRYGACWDGNGQHPKGTMEVGRLGPQVRWADGLVAP
jgi:hypothetical protein